MLTLRVHDLWEALQERLATGRMAAILGGGGRVYTPKDHSGQENEREGALDEPWGRIVLLTRTTLWPQRDVPGEMKNVAFLVSVQFNDFRAPGYDVGLAVDAAHEEVYRLLDNYVPSLSRATVAVPIWRYGKPPEHPVLDQPRKLWLSNAEYRTQVVPTEA